MKPTHPSQLHPTAKKEVVIAEPGNGETIVYDLQSDKAHCLNPTASFVWNHCDGRTSVSEIASQFSQQHGQAMDESVIWLALKQLGKAQLLEGEFDNTHFTDVSRRVVLRKLGLAMAIALPVVTTLLAPEAARAGSKFPVGTPCTSPAQCPNSCTGTPLQCI